MPTQEEIADQQSLLSTHRRTLAHFLKQRAALGDAFAPPAVTHGIHEARNHIHRIKGVLQQWGFAIDDHPDDEPLPSLFTFSDAQIFKSFIEEKTQEFVGRQFVFNAITQFTESSPRGYFRISGDPGIGKSALAAHMVRTNGYIHHFNISAQGTGRFDRFARNISAQLIAMYGLNHHILPQEVAHDPGMLDHLLREAAQTLSPSEKIIIVVDALDEVDNSGMPQEANTLYLPPVLPNGVYIVCTMRRMRREDQRVRLHIECEHDTKEIKQNEPDNLADIRHYIELSATRPKIQAYITNQGINETLFAEDLTRKSQGNFLYLRYVLPEIEKGAYTGMELEALPEGLAGHYDRYWKRMRGEAGNDWFRYKLPVIMALAVAKESISIDLITDFSRVQERPRIRTVLQEWEQFLYTERVEYEGSIQNRYRLYHSSFRDFIASKDEIEEEGVDIIGTIKNKVDDRWKELFGDE